MKCGKRAYQRKRPGAFTQKRTGPQARSKPENDRDKEIERLRSEGKKWDEVHDDVRGKWKRGRPLRLGEYEHADIVELKKAYGFTTQEIVEILKLDGVNVCRQTVANYLKRELRTDAPWRTAVRDLAEKITGNDFTGITITGMSQAYIKPSGLHIAVAQNDEAVAKHLIGKGVDVNSRECFYEWTPLHLAATIGSAEIVRLLIQNGADVEACDVDLYRSTPLHFAAQLGKLLAVKALVENGADPESADKQERTPGQLAEMNGHTNVAEYLSDRKSPSQV